jgi:hypothetical protein
MSYVTHTALAQCRHCGGGLPLLGPVRTVKCSACQADNVFEPERIADFLHYASQHFKAIMNELQWTYAERHTCPTCNAAIDLAAFPLGTATSQPCPGCATPIRSVPAPAWLRERLPQITQLYGADLDPDDQPAGMPATVPARAAAPIVTRCPECNGTLRVTGDSARTIVCEYCKANVFLPDDLWRALHPVKRVAFWTFAFEGPPPLQRTKDLREIEEKQRRDAEDRARQQREREANEARAAEEAAAEAIQARKGSVGLVFLVFLAVAAFGGIVFYFVR